MKMEVDRAWFEKRSKLEGEHEIGAGGRRRRELPDPSPLRAMLIGMAAVPAAACLQILALVLIVGMVGSHGIVDSILGMGIFLFPALVIAYVLGAIPTITGAVLMYPVMRANYSALTEYLAAAVIGGVVMIFYMTTFVRAELFVAWVVGILPAIAGVWAYRRILPREVR